MAEQTVAPEVVNGREVVFWDLNPNAEELSHTTIEDAIDDALYGFTREAAGETTITVYGWARRPLPTIDEIANGWGSPLQKLLDHLEEEGYCDPNESTIQTPAMIAAEREFIRAVLDHYPVWACDVVVERTVKVRDYLEVDDAEA